MNRSIPNLQSRARRPQGDNLPSAENAIALTLSPNAWGVKLSVDTLNNPVSAATRIRVPSGEKETHRIQLEFAPNVLLEPVETSQTRTVESSELEVIYLPSCEYATELTWCSCPLNELGGNSPFDCFIPSASDDMET